MKLLLVTLILAQCVANGHGFLWSFSNGLSDYFSVDRIKRVVTEFSDNSELLAIKSFEFGRDGTYRMNLSLALFGQVLPYYTGASPTAEGSNESGFSIIACNEEAYRDLYDAEVRLRGSYCNYLHQNLACVEYPTNYSFRSDASDPTYLGTWQVDTDVVTTTDDSKIYFILAACSFMDRYFVPTSVQAQVIAEYEFRNAGGTFLSQGEIMFMYGLYGLVFLLLILTGIWYFHIYRWVKKQDVKLQVSLSFVLVLKSLVLLLCAINLLIKSEGGSVFATDLLYYLRFFFTTLFYLVFMERMFLLGLGLKITTNRLSPSDRLKVNRMTLSFGLLTVLFFWWGKVSIMLWILVMFLYVVLTSSMFQLTTANIRHLEYEYAISQEDTMIAAGTPEESTCAMRERYLKETCRIFQVLRWIIIFYFCLTPFIVMVTQIVAIRLNANEYIITYVSEGLDIIMLVILGYNYRIRPVDMFFPSQNTEESSVTNVEMREVSEIRLSAVAPAIQSETDDIEKGISNKKQTSTREQASPIVTITNAGDETQCTVAIIQDYNNN
mmetsp:Transcript_6216/g.9799  ORF Transcript_6216/g.9799 Transcript_6216/m.9799 type:complete len:551 (-) Transcript_6216:766-2418(-)|eukprot:CAMPEP_0203792750 /NCGR_PEP_ID=MMETSP0100_2-20121128/5439_1 /ASSEMBLY_ACC=CAM_ASM_000210 /TAXON_ID=96639 /ORGANISM=" , Strain NY0313808BC1" /LENGTH=550 /DNA_ID=CAMNT_0050696365 /DNA_START=1333 /DNA_END=2985 /DNA_ORIENTATION=+